MDIFVLVSFWFFLNQIAARLVALASFESLVPTPVQLTVGIVIRIPMVIWAFYLLWSI